MVLSSKPVYFFEEAMEIMVRTVNIEPITKERQLLVIFIHLYKKTSRCAVTTGILYDSFNACTILLTLSM